MNDMRKLMHNKKKKEITSNIKKCIKTEHKTVTDTIIIEETEDSESHCTSPELSPKYCYKLSTMLVYHK